MLFLFFYLFIFFFLIFHCWYLTTCVFVFFILFFFNYGIIFLYDSFFLLFFYFVSMFRSFGLDFVISFFSFSFDFCFFLNSFEFGRFLFFGSSFIYLNLFVVFFFCCLYLFLSFFPLFLVRLYRYFLRFHLKYVFLFLSSCSRLSKFLFHIFTVAERWLYGTGYSDFGKCPFTYFGDSIYIPEARHYIVYGNSIICNFDSLDLFCELVYRGPLNDDLYFFPSFSCYFDRAIHNPWVQFLVDTSLMDYAPNYPEGLDSDSEEIQSLDSDERFALYGSRIISIPSGLISYFSNISSSDFSSGNINTFLDASFHKFEIPSDRGVLDLSRSFSNESLYLLVVYMHMPRRVFVSSCGVPLCDGYNESYDYILIHLSRFISRDDYLGMYYRDDYPYLKVPFYMNFPFRDLFVSTLCFFLGFLLYFILGYSLLSAPVLFLFVIFFCFFMFFFMFFLIILFRLSSSNFISFEVGIFSILNRLSSCFVPFFLFVIPAFIGFLGCLFFFAYLLYSYLYVPYRNIFSFHSYISELFRHKRAHQLYLESCRLMDASYKALYGSKFNTPLKHL